MVQVFILQVLHSYNILVITLYLDAPEDTKTAEN